MDKSDRIIDKQSPHQESQLNVILIAAFASTPEAFSLVFIRLRHVNDGKTAILPSDFNLLRIFHLILPPSPIMSEIFMSLRRGPRQAHPGIEIPLPTSPEQSPKACRPALSQCKVEKSTRPQYFRRKKSFRPPGSRTFAEQSGKVLTPTGLVDFCRAKCESVPGPGFFRRAFFPAFFFAARFFARKKAASL